MQTYLYDSSASPIGIQVNSGTNESTYLFRKNFQGERAQTVDYRLGEVMAPKQGVSRAELDDYEK